MLSSSNRHIASFEGVSTQALVAPKGQTTLTPIDQMRLARLVVLQCPVQGPGNAQGEAIFADTARNDRQVHEGARTDIKKVTPRRAGVTAW